MIPLLADFPTSTPVQFGAWMFSAACAIWFFNQARKAVDSFSEKPSPAQTYATKSEVAGLRSELNEVRTQMQLDRQSILEAGEQRAIKIHDRINKLQTDGDEKLRHIPAEIISLLRNTGHLGSHD
jgi:hypothetical protein